MTAGTRKKRPHGYHKSFDDWWERDLEAFLRRDRNHPQRNSMVRGQRGSLSRPAPATAIWWPSGWRRKARSLDSSRPVLLTLCTLWTGLDDQDMEEQRRRQAEGGLKQNQDSGYTYEIWADRTESMAAPLDVVGYNYLDDRYPGGP